MEPCAFALLLAIRILPPRLEHRTERGRVAACPIGPPASGDGHPILFTPNDDLSCLKLAGSFSQDAAPAISPCHTVLVPRERGLNMTQSPCRLSRVLVLDLLSLPLSRRNACLPDASPTMPSFFPHRQTRGILLCLLASGHFSKDLPEFLAQPPCHSAQSNYLPATQKREICVCALPSHTAPTVRHADNSLSINGMVRLCRIPVIVSHPPPQPAVFQATANEKSALVRYPAILYGA